METSKEISKEKLVMVKGFAPPRCPKCGGSVYLASTKILLGLFSKVITIPTCIICGFFGHTTNKYCSVCGKAIIEIKTKNGSVEECLGCHDKWTSNFIYNFYLKKLEKKLKNV